VRNGAGLVAAKRVELPGRGTHTRETGDFSSSMTTLRYQIFLFLSCTHYQRKKVHKKTPHGQWEIGSGHGQMVAFFLALGHLRQSPSEISQAHMLI
jgi:hypothetical protein